MSKAQITAPITSLLPGEIAKVLEEKSFRGDQIFSWIHQRSVKTFEEMSNLSKEMRQKLLEKYRAPASSQVTTTKVAKDGTVKFLVQYQDGAQVEVVLLSDGKDRKTVCISSQVGCAMGCTFCNTGTMGLHRNLLAGEIVEQLIHCKQLFDAPSHIVFMGMGEPLANIDEVSRAIEIFHHPKGHNISLRRITLSTCGLPAGLERWINQGPKVRLAISLHSAVPETRKELMPLLEETNLEKIRTLLLQYQQAGGKRVTFEYLHLPGINDTKREIQTLKTYCKDLSVLINIIPWNPVEELPYRAPRKEETKGLLDKLTSAGLNATARISKGRDIDGACGQLAAKQ